MGTKRQSPSENSSTGPPKEAIRAFWPKINATSLTSTRAQLELTLNRVDHMTAGLSLQLALFPEKYEPATRQHLFPTFEALQSRRNGTILAAEQPDS
jgi:hypothetical protein